jgi:hypothetical protein
LHLRRIAADRETQRLPGPQQKRHHFAIGILSLYAVLVLIMLMTAQAVIRQNVPEGHRTGFIKLDLISSATGFSLLVGLVTILAVRYNVALGIRPILTYTSQAGLPERTSTSFGRSWVVTLRNSGGGVALIRRVEFYVRFRNAAGGRIQGPLDHSEIIALLATQGVHNGKQAWLSRLSDGFALAPDQTHVLAELSVEAIEKVRLLDVEILFDGLLESRYVKNAFLLPRVELETQFPEVIGHMSATTKGAKGAG